MIDHSLIRLVPGEEIHREFNYQVRKAAYGGLITRVWGWDENKQRELHTRDWQEHQPEIILYRDSPIGTITIVESEGGWELERFYIMPEYHNQGIGTGVLKSIMDRADKLGKIIKLMVLTINPAKSLYLKNGFTTVREDNLFYFMERKPEGMR